MERLMEQMNCFLEKRKSGPKIKILSSIQKNKILKIKNSHLKLENNFRELRDRELKLNERPIY